jgi:hypothetical protein
MGDAQRDPNVKTVQLKPETAKEYTDFLTGKKRKGTAKRQKGGAAEASSASSISNIPPGPSLNTKTVSMQIQKGGGASAPALGQLPVKISDAIGLGSPGNPPLTQTMIGTNPQNPSIIRTPAMEAARAAGTQPNVLPSQANILQNVQGVVQQNVQPVQAAQAAQAGGARASGLVLAPKKKPTGRLLLAPPKAKGTAAGHRASTRKIKVNLTNMKRRIHTAKLIHKDSKDKSIDEIRRLLESAKLIKPAKEGKKVPEDILRNIYKDYLILRNKAL